MLFLPLRPASRRTVPNLLFIAIPVIFDLMNKPRYRHDGWTPARRSRFLARLRSGDSIGRAAAAVGMSRESAHRLRRRPGATRFADAWITARAVSPPDPAALDRAGRRPAPDPLPATTRFAAMSTRQLLRLLTRKSFDANDFGKAMPVRRCESAVTFAAPVIRPTTAPKCEAGVTFNATASAASALPGREAAVTFAVPRDAPQRVADCEGGVTFAAAQNAPDPVSKREAAVTFAAPATPPRPLNRHEFRRARALARRRAA